MPIHAALALALVESVALAAVLLHRAAEVRGARPLAAFLLGVGAWVVGNELPTWSGPGMDGPALAVLSTASLTSAAFLHFGLAYLGQGTGRGTLAAVYGVAGSAALLALAVPPGRFTDVPDVGLVAVPNAVGWASVAVWSGLAAAGQCVLARGLVAAEGAERRGIAAIMAASAWGLACMSGYGLPALGVPSYPWPLLGLPLYPAILVYGILRYRVLVANAWARRALTWLILVAAATGVAATAGALAATMPGVAPTWSAGAAAAGATLLLGGPARRLAERIVYPGHAVSANDMRAWRAAMADAGDARALAAVAEALLRDALRIDVAVSVAGASGGAPASGPVLACDGAGSAWDCAMGGWEAAPPGQRRLAGLFSDVLAGEAARIAGLEASRAAERALLDRERLAELGAIAASVAHDLRNPLNNIGMAVALAPREVRDDVGGEVRRIARLAEDLLDYAKPWRVEPRPLDASAALRALAARHRGVEAGEGLDAPVMVMADPGRLDQALSNLVGNAVSAGTRVRLEAEASGGTATLRVLDDGPGIPAEVRECLFQPFVSRRPGGTGLGLAIVSKVMAAHGGRVELAEVPGWSTCFALTMPAAP